MYKIEFNENEKYFQLNGKNYPRIYQAISLGESSIGIYNLYDVRHQILSATPVDEVMVNGQTFTSKEEIIDVLIPILFDNLGTDVRANLLENTQKIDQFTSEITDAQDVILKGKSGMAFTTRAAFNTKYEALSQTDKDDIQDIQVLIYDDGSSNGYYKITAGAANNLEFVDYIKDVENIFSIIKDTNFSSFNSVTNLNAWKELVSGNTYNFSNGFAELTTIGTDQNLSYQIDKNLPSIGDTILVSFTAVLSENVVLVPQLNIVLATDNSSGYVFDVLNCPTTAGTHKVYKEITIDNINGTVLNGLRTDFRLKTDGIKVGNLKVVNKKLVEFNAPQIVNETRKIFTPTYEAYLNRFSVKELFVNESTQQLSSYLTNTTYTRTDLGNNVVKVSGEVPVGVATRYVYFNFSKDGVWRPNHKYYLAIAVTVNDIDNTVDGNFSPTILPKRATNETIGSTELKQTVLEGNSGIIKAEITTSDQSTILDADNLFIQLAASAFTEGEAFDIDFENMFIVDLGEVGEATSYNEMDGYFSTYGFLPEKKEVTIKDLKESAPEEGNEVVLKDIQVTGDSLASQSWANGLLATLTGRNCFKLAFGGKKSYYVRDQFLSNLDVISKDRTHVFYVGRNNNQEIDFIIDDLRTMVDAIEHDRFLILMPPNGGYGNMDTSGDMSGSGSFEMRGGDNYNRFLELEKRLKKTFPSNFVDSRSGLINRYNMGGIRLTAPFTQPALNATVQITVGNAFEGSDNELSGTAFLSTENSSDASNYSALSGKIRITTSLYGSSDVYEIVSVDSATQMTVRLLENNSSFSPGSTVDNITDEGAVKKYLKVIQNLDFITWQNDTQISSARADGVHLSVYGETVIAKLVSEALKAKGI